MWQSSCARIYPNLTRESVWRVWTDVNRWPAWDAGLAATHLAGDFVAGARFTLTPKGGPTVRLRLESVEPGVRFTDVTFLPLARLYDAHEIEDTPAGLRLASTLTVTGPLSGLWRRLLVQGIAAGAARQMDALAAHAAAA